MMFLELFGRHCMFAKSTLPLQLSIFLEQKNTD